MTDTSPPIDSATIVPSPQSVLPPSLLVVDGWVGQMERYSPLVGLLLALRTTQHVLPVVGFAA